VLATVGVYGSVGAILKLEDAGTCLYCRTGAHAIARCSRRIGAALIVLAPRLVGTLSVLGTAAAFLIGGELVAPGMPGAEEAIECAADRLASSSVIGCLFGWAIGPFLETALGLAWRNVLPRAAAAGRSAGVRFGK
jgi:predicted DNA repair protein MutK